MKSRMLRYAALSTGLMLAALGLGGCGPFGLVGAGLAALVATGNLNLGT